MVGEQVAEHRCGGKAAVVLEALYQLVDGKAVAEGGAVAAKGRRALEAGAAEVAVGSWKRALRTVRHAVPGQVVEAAFAQTIAAGVATAQQAGVWEAATRVPQCERDRRQCRVEPALKK